MEILSDKDIRPIFLMTSDEYKRMPDSVSGDVPDESTKAKLNTIQNLLEILSDKVDDKANNIVNEVRVTASKTYAEATVMSENNLTVRNNTRKRSRVNDSIDMDDGARISTAEEVFVEQSRRGFRRNSSKKDNDNINRKNNERRRHDTVVGSSKNADNLSANFDAFVFNVNKEANEDIIKEFMKKNKNLHIVDIETKSHPDARTKSFRVQVRASDAKKVMEPETWPELVKVRPFRHQRIGRDRSNAGQFR